MVFPFTFSVSTIPNPFTTQRAPEPDLTSSSDMRFGGGDRDPNPRKRAWLPATSSLVPSLAVSSATSEPGYLDTPSKYLEAAARASGASECRAPTRGCHTGARPLSYLRPLTRSCFPHARPGRRRGRAGARPAGQEAADHRRLHYLDRPQRRPHRHRRRHRRLSRLARQRQAGRAAAAAAGGPAPARARGEAAAPAPVPPWRLGLGLPGVPAPAGRPHAAQGRAPHASHPRRRASPQDIAPARAAAHAPAASLRPAQPLAQAGPRKRGWGRGARVRGPCRLDEQPAGQADRAGQARARPGGRAALRRGGRRTRARRGGGRERVGRRRAAGEFDVLQPLSRRVAVVVVPVLLDAPRPHVAIPQHPTALAAERELSFCSPAPAVRILRVAAHTGVRARRRGGRARAQPRAARAHGARTRGARLALARKPGTERNPPVPFSPSVSMAYGHPPPATLHLSLLD